MLSRTAPQYKIVYCHFMSEFERAFNLKTFKGLNAALN